MGNALMEDSGDGAKGKGGTKKEEVVSLPDLPLELVGKVDVGTADNNNPEMDMEETKQVSAIK